MVHVRRKFVDVFEREESFIGKEASSGSQGSTPSKSARYTLQEMRVALR